MQAWIEPLGWMLVHSVWLISVIVAVAAVVLSLLRRRSANARYLVGCVALVLSVSVLPGVFAWVMAQPQQTTEPVVVSKKTMTVNVGDAIDLDGLGEKVRVEADPGFDGQQVPLQVTELQTADGHRIVDVDVVRSTESSASVSPGERSTWQQIEARLRPHLAWLVSGWLAGVCLLSLRPLIGWHATWRLRRVGLSEVPDSVSVMLHRLAERLGLRRATKIFQSSLVRIPCVIGAFKPVILLPASVLVGLSPEQLEALLAHELAHIRRHDFAVNIVQTLAETLLFYHPAIWWLSRRIRQEREHCCDDLAISVCGDVVGYARMLVSVEGLRARVPQTSMAASGGSLVERVRRLVPSAPEQPRSPFLAGIIVLGTLVVAVGSGVAFVSDEPALGVGLPTAPDQTTEGHSIVARPRSTDAADANDETFGPTERRGHETRAERKVSRAEREVKTPKRSPNPLVTVLQPAPEKASLDAAGEVMPMGMVQRLGSTRFKVPGWWRRFGFAGNDEWIWIKADERVSVIHRETGRVVKHHQLRLGEGSVRTLTTSADGTRVAIGLFEPPYPSDTNRQANYRVVVMSALTTAHLQELKWNSPPDDLNCLSFSGDGATLLTGTERGDVRLWDVETGKQLRQQAFEEGAGLFDAAMSPDGRSVVLGGRRMSFFWKLADDAGPIKLANDSGDSVSFAPNGRLFSTIGREGARLWNAENGEQIAHFKTKEFENYSDADFGHSFTPDSKVLAVPVVSYDVVELWDVETKQRVATLPVHHPRGVTISRDGRWLAAAGQESFTAIFDLKTRQQVNPPGDGHSQEVLSVRFAGTKSLASSSDGDARVWDIKSGKQQQTLPHQDKTTTVRGLAASPDGTQIVTSAFDDTLGLWDRATGKRLFTLKGHGTRGGTRAVRFKADGSQFVSWGDDAVLRWWNAKDGSLIAAHPLEVPGYTYQEEGRNPLDAFWLCAAFAPDTKSLFVVFEKTLSEFDTQTGKRLREVPIPPRTKPLAVSADGRWLAAGESRRDEQGNTTSTAIVLRDRATLKVVREWPVSDPHEAAANADPNRKPSISHVAETDSGMAFSPDSRFLAWSRIDAHPGIDLVEVEHDRHHASIPVESPVWCLDFSSDGNHIASGHADSTISVWSIGSQGFKVGMGRGRVFDFSKLAGIESDPPTEPDARQFRKIEHPTPDTPTPDVTIVGEVVELISADQLPVKDVSHINDPDVLLDQLAKGPRVSQVLMTGYGVFWQPGTPPQAMYVTLWTQQFAADKQLDPRVRQLIKLGDAARAKVEQRLLSAKPVVASHLALTLRSTGTAESIPLLIRVLRELSQPGVPVGESSQSMTTLAATSALWELTGRRHVFTPTQWEKWWDGVKTDFVVARDRQRPEVAARVTAERVQRLVQELGRQEEAARERLIALGPGAVPHLIATLNVAESLRDSASASRSDAATRLAWVIDELGATAKLPAKLRRDYFTQRFLDGGTYVGYFPIDEQAACRALSHCSFADFCDICLKADGQSNDPQALRLRGWMHLNAQIFSRRFNHKPAFIGGDPSQTPLWNDIRPAADPAAEIAGAIPIIVAALSDKEPLVRQCAAKLADVIGLCSAERPEALITALRDHWLSEQDANIRQNIGIAMARFAKPMVQEAISKGLRSDRLEIVSDAAGLMSDIPLNDTTKPDFERLVKLTRHENDRVRRGATRSLAYKAPQLLGPEFERLCTDKVKDIRESCTVALRDKPDPKHADILFKLADDTDQSIRESAFSSIGNLDHPASMKRLLPHLRDKKVHGYAVSALASMGGRDALPLMMSELETGNDVGGMVYQHLRRLTGERFEEKPEPWLAWWKNQKPAPKPGDALPNKSSKP